MTHRLYKKGETEMIILDNLGRRVVSFLVKYSGEGYSLAISDFREVLNNQNSRKTTEKSSKYLGIDREKAFEAAHKIATTLARELDLNFSDYTGFRKGIISNSTEEITQVRSLDEIF